MVVSRKWAPRLGFLLWAVVSAGLTLAGAHAVPIGGERIALLLYAVGLIPGVLGVRRLVAANMAVLASGPTLVSPTRLFIPRFWLMMVLMAGLGQLLRLAPVHPWLHVGFLLISASALLCGALVFLVYALRR